MMSLRRHIIAAVLSPLMLTGCGGAPSCDSRAVVDTIKERLVRQLKDVWAGSASGGILGGLVSDGAYDGLKKAAATDASAKDQLDAVDKMANSLTIELQDIRPIAIDEKVKKSVCTAQLKMSGPGGSNSDSINYVAQQGSNGLVAELK